MSDIEYTPEMKWYVVHTYSGYENKVKSNLEKIVENRGLQEMFEDICIPVEKTTETDGENTKEVEIKIFPCYVFVKMIMSDLTWHVVRNINGVTGFVGPGSRPVPLTDREVTEMGLESADAMSIGTVKDLPYKIGDSVRVTSGSFSGFIGSVSSISEDKTRVMVMLNMFGRETAAEIDADSLEILTF